MLKRFISRLLNEKLPTKTKRQVFLVSFAALLRGATTYDREIFQRLNHVLALSETGESALAVPAILSKVIWDGKTTYEICQEDVTQGSFTADRIATVVANILNSMPSWLLYGNREEIESDIAVILKGRIELLGA
jgi:hypothetical protein